MGGFAVASRIGSRLPDFEASGCMISVGTRGDVAWIWCVMVVLGLGYGGLFVDVLVGLLLI